MNQRLLKNVQIVLYFFGLVNSELILTLEQLLELVNAGLISPTTIGGSDSDDEQDGES